MTTKAPARSSDAMVSDTPPVNRPPSRPVLLESGVFRAEIENTMRAATGEIDLLDASELQAEADFKNAVEMLQQRREAERNAQKSRRDDLSRVVDGCRAALDASDEKPAQ